MKRSSTTLFVGLDVHKESIAVALAPAGADRSWLARLVTRRERPEEGPRP